MHIDRALTYYSFYGKGCGCGQDHGISMKAWTVRKSVEAIQTLWDLGLKALNFKDKFFKSYITDKSNSYQEQLEKGLKTDAKTLIQAGDTKGYQRFTTMRENVWQFGAGSVKEEYSAVEKLTKVLKAEGKDIAEESTQKMINALQDRYQVEFKKVEDATIEASGIMAKKWDVITESGKMLKYSTVGDSHVRTSHQKLDGIVKPADDPFWNKHYPPIDFGCRCDAEETNDLEYTGEIPVVATNPGISGNVGKTGTIFTDKHPYMDTEGKELGNKLLTAKVREDVVSYAKTIRGEYELDYNGEKVKVNLGIKAIDKMTSSKSEDYNLKNESIYSFKEWSKNLAFKGEEPNQKLDAKPLIDKYLYYETEVMNRKLSISVEAHKDGSFRFYHLQTIKGPSTGTQPE